jgi:hypothetical protein
MKKKVTTLNQDWTSRYGRYSWEKCVNVLVEKNKRGKISYGTRDVVEAVVVQETGT